MGALPGCPQSAFHSEMGQTVVAPDTYSLLDLGPKWTLPVHAGVEKSSESQHLPLPPSCFPPSLGLEVALD